MQDAKREILQKVATGAISAEEAAAELEAMEGGAEPAASAPLAAPPSGGIARVKIMAALGSVTVIGDESVLEAVADGPHTARRENGVMVIESDQDAIGTGFIFTGGRFGFTRQVTIRMNPRLPLEADLDAGSLRVQGVRGPIKANIQAGSTRIEGFTEPIDLDIQAGSVRLSGRLTEGRSRISCQAGKVSVQLDRQSSVKIAARTSMGKITLPGTPSVTGWGDGTASAQVGGGAGSLEINSEMGAVTVEVAG